MLAKKYRLPVQSFFLGRSRTFKNAAFLLKVGSNTLPFNRFGVSISKKVSKKATRRNELRRAIFNFLRMHEAQKARNTPARDFLVIILPGAEKLKREKLTDQFGELLNKIG